jgi:hypothetical protein
MGLSGEHRSRTSAPSEGLSLRPSGRELGLSLYRLIATASARSNEDEPARTERLSPNPRRYLPSVVVVSVELAFSFLAFFFFLFFLLEPTTTSEVLATERNELVLDVEKKGDDPVRPKEKEYQATPDVQPAQLRDHPNRHSSTNVLKTTG